MCKRPLSSVNRSLRQASSACFVMVAFAIPLQEQSGWKQEKYSKIPKNEVIFTREGLVVKVDGSASPLIYPLLPAKQISGFHVVGEFRGLPKFAKLSDQGEKGSDDYALRVGFVIPGATRLSGVKRFFAPTWIKNLYSALPGDVGIGGVQFFNVTQSKAQLGLKRTHPSSRLITEEFFELTINGGKFDYSYDFKEPMEVAAVWLSIDGDDTKSKFEVVVKQLELLGK